MLAVYFLVTDSPIDDILHLLGPELTGELCLYLGRPARVVPKLTLVMHNPGVFKERSWASGVEFLWPDTKVVAEGRNDIAIEFALKGQ